MEWQWHPDESVEQPGANLSHANLTHANLTGANLMGADLTKVVGLTQDQIDSALGLTQEQIDKAHFHGPKPKVKSGKPITVPVLP